jgi:hypothetical protein
VLPDGRVIVEGGEYQYGNGPTNPPTAIRTNLGGIYDPVVDSWTPINPPVNPATSTTPATTWPQIGDAPSIVLPNGTFMMGQLYTRNVALLNTAATPVSWKIFNPGTWSMTAGTGKLQRGGDHLSSETRQARGPRGAPESWRSSCVLLLLTQRRAGSSARNSLNLDV